MNREDAKDLTLSVLVIVNVALVVFSILLYVKSVDQAEATAALSERLELHLNPPPKKEGPSLMEKAKAAYTKVRSAAVKGYNAAKEEYSKEEKK